VNDLYEIEEIAYRPHLQSEAITAKVVKYSPKFRIVTLQVTFGRFEFEVTVLNEERPSSSHYFNCKTSRADSSILFAFTEDQEVVIKCFPFSDPTQSSEAFGKALRELCFLKVAHGLGLGPKLTNMSGFDLIFYENCVELSMERCEEIPKVIHSIGDEELKGLKRDLLTLHHFSIVHLDIKPMNILFSPSSKKLVFLDFGFSKLVKEILGQRTRTEFLGTPQYCGPEML
jgi:serine/threonine protein kinase